MEGEFNHKTASNSGMNLLEGRGKQPDLRLMRRATAQQPPALNRREVLALVHVAANSPHKLGPRTQPHGSSGPASLSEHLSPMDGSDRSVSQ